MKGNSLILGLAFVLAALSLGVTLLAYQYVQLTRAFNGAQSTLAQVELRQNRLKALLAEAVEYAKTDSSINPILQSIGARAGTGAAAANGPATGSPATSPAPKAPAAGAKPAAPKTAGH